MSPLTEPTKLTLAKTYVGIDDPDAAAYIAAVEAADEIASPGVGALETATKVAIHSFVKGCKADGIWPAIKASCILAGARTLEGALVPLAGTAPNKFGTAANWNYNRKTGLQGDGSTNYIDSNRADNADPQNSAHMSVYVSTIDSRWTIATAIFYLGSANSINTSRRSVGPYQSGLYFNNRSGPAPSGSGSLAGFMGSSRASSSEHSVRRGGASASLSVSSVAPGSQTVAVFASNQNGTINAHTDARLAFYSIGEALDLALLDTRVSNLITAFGAAIP